MKVKVLFITSYPINTHVASVGSNYSTVYVSPYFTVKQLWTSKTGNFFADSVFGVLRCCEYCIFFLNRDPIWLCLMGKCQFGT